MRFKDKNFPYPVIRPYEDDFQKSIFDVNIEEDIKNNRLILKGEVILTNQAIISEIKEGNAIYAIHLEESETMFREAHYFSDTNFEISISLDLIRSELEVVTFITATNQIRNFQSNDLISIFDDLKIDYDKNNIIGIGSPMKIDIIKENDEIKAVSSIFMVIPSDDIKNIFELSLEQDRVTIKLSRKTFSLYNELSNSFLITNSEDNIILLTIMVLPVFVETLNILKTDYHSYESTRWFDSIVVAFEKNNINILEEFKKEDFDSYKLSQIIFDEIIEKSLRRLKVLSLEEN